MQYYNLIHLGFQGYREVMENCLANARLLSKSLEATGWYHCLSDVHRKVPLQTAVKEHLRTAVAGERDSTGGESSAQYVAGLPVVSFRFSDGFKREYPHIKQETVSLLLRARQWIIPNYALPPKEDGTEILRVVVRESMSFDLLDRLVTDIVKVTQTLMENDEVDLSILQSSGRRAAAERKDEGNAPRRGRVSEFGDELRRMMDGIHRSVC